MRIRTKPPKQPAVRLGVLQTRGHGPQHFHTVVAANEYNWANGDFGQLSRLLGLVPVTEARATFIASRSARPLWRELCGECVDWRELPRVPDLFLPGHHNNARGTRLPSVMTTHRSRTPGGGACRPGPGTSVTREAFVVAALRHFAACLHRVPRRGVPGEGRGPHPCTTRRWWLSGWATWLRGVRARRPRRSPR